MTPHTGSAAAAVLAASFRDPAGALVDLDGRILRVVNATGWADLAAFLNARAAVGLFDSGKVVRSRVLDAEETESLLHDRRLRQVYESAGGRMLLEHERIWFPSFPYEWPPEMLHAAAELTLDIALALVDAGLGLKDGTPYNVLFRGPDPVFIDLLSFERRAPEDPTWLPYAQFARTFLLPLLANKYFGLSIEQILTTRRDGLEPEEVYAWLKLRQKLRPPFLSLVSMPAWLGRRHKQNDNGLYRRRSAGSPEKAQFILDRLLRGLKRKLAVLRPAPGRRSTWSAYMSANNNYTAAQFAAKRAFVEAAMNEFRPKRVLDVGANTGHFSAIAARNGASVVAIDSDPVVLGEIWRMAWRQRLDILPLAVNLTRPTPGIGWRNRECASFLDRAQGSFDAVLMLAVIHHMLVTERVPLKDIVDAAAELTNDIAVIEFVGPEDSMFRRLTRGREELHRGLSPQVFEYECRRRFEVVRKQHGANTSRWLYLLKKTS